MKKIKLLTSLVAAAGLSGVAMTIASCGCTTSNEKIIPIDSLNIVDYTVKGFKEGSDISGYNTLLIPEGVKIVDTNAFNNEKINYSEIKTLRFTNSIEEIRENAFAGLTKLELIDFSSLTLDSIYKLTIQEKAFGTNNKLYCQIKMPENVSDKVLETLKNKLTQAGVSESWLVKPTNDNVVVAEEKKAITYDGIDPTKNEVELTKWVKSSNKIDVEVTRTGGTDGVDVKLIGEPSYSKNKLSYKVELAPEGRNVQEGDYCDYKVTIVQKTITETSNSETTDWVQIIDNLKISYLKPEIYVAKIDVNLAHPEKIYHQGDIVNKNDIIVETVNNDKSRAILNYGTDGYSVEGYDFENGYTLTEDDIRGQTKTFKVKYSKKGVGSFEANITFSNLKLKVTNIAISGPTTVERGTLSTEYTATLSPVGAQTNLIWTIEPETQGITINNGILSIANDATAPTNIKVVATDATNPEMVGKSDSISITIPAVQEVEFTQKYTTVYRGSGQETYQFKARPTNPACKQDIVWSLSKDYSGEANPDKKVSISQTGVLTIGKKAVNETINVIATAKDTTISASWPINITTPQVSNITITCTGESSIKRYIEEKQYTATVTPDGADQTIAWSLKNSPEHISITNGLLKADENALPQEVTIIVNGADSKSATKTANIYYAPSTSVVINESSVASIDRGTNKTFTATVKSGESEKGALQKVKWSIVSTKGEGTSIDENSGVLTIGDQVSESTVTIRAQALNDDESEITGVYAEHQLNITIPAIETLTISGASSFERGQAETYSIASVTPAGATHDVTWSITTAGVSSETYFDTSTPGLLKTYVQESKTSLTIRATTTGQVAAGKTGYAESAVTLTIPLATSISISGPSTLERGTQSTDFEASVEGPAAIHDVTWSISAGAEDGKAILTPNGNKCKLELKEDYTVLNTGKITIRATVNDSSGKYKDWPIVITYPKATSVVFETAPSSITRGTSETYLAKVVPTAADQTKITYSVSGDETLHAGTKFTKNSLACGEQENNTSLSITATATDFEASNDAPTATTSSTVIIPPLTGFDVTNWDKEKFSQGTNLTFTVSKVYPSAALYKFDWTLDSEAESKGITISKSDDKSCTLSAADDAIINDTFTLTITPKDQTAASLTKSKTFTIIKPAFAEATWERIAGAAKTFRESAAEDRCKTLCETFSDVDYYEEGTTDEEKLKNFIGKTKYCKYNNRNIKFVVADVCKDTVANTSYKAAFVLMALDWCLVDVYWGEYNNHYSKSNVHKQINNKNFEFNKNLIPYVYKSDPSGAAGNYQAYLLSADEMGGYSFAYNKGKTNPNAVFSNIGVRDRAITRSSITASYTTCWCPQAGEWSWYTNRNYTSTVVYFAFDL